MVAVPLAEDMLKPEGMKEREETLENGLPNSLTPIVAPLLEPALSFAQSHSFAVTFFNIWPSEQTAPSGLISPKKAMSPEMEAVPENDAPPTTSNAVVRSWVPIPTLPPVET